MRAQVQNDSLPPALGGSVELLSSIIKVYCPRLIEIVIIQRTKHYLFFKLNGFNVRLKTLPC